MSVRVFPTDEQIDTAIEWLRINEGELGEAEACHKVADWLSHLQNERLVRKVVRRTGVSTAIIRERMKVKE